MNPSAGKEKNKSKHRLSGILSFHFLSFFSVVFVIMGVAIVVLTFQNQQKIVFFQHEFIAGHATDIVEKFFDKEFTSLETTARLVNPALTSPAEEQRILNYLFGAHVAFRYLVLMNSKGQYVDYASRHSTVLTREVLNEKILGESFAKANNNTRYISEVQIDAVTNEPMVVISVPIKDVFGDFQGVLAAEVNLKFIWDLVENLKIGKSGVAYVVDRKGSLIAFNDISRVLRNENVGKLAIVKVFMQNPEPGDSAHVEIFTGIQGTTVIGTYVSLVQPDLALVTEEPILEAYDTVIQFWVGFLVFAIIMWFVIFRISTRLARRISIPLVNLMGVAVRIAGGERSLRADVEGPVEIAGMADAFNSMTMQLNEVIQSLEKRSKHLQATVREYVEYMDEVGKGRLDLRLVLEEPGEGAIDPLIILGRQLNDTTANLQRKIAQIQQTTNELLRQEEKLKLYATKLERSNTELEQFAFVASHDLQEPLRKLNYFGKRLQTNYGNLLDEKAIEYITRMNNAVLRMQDFIRDLLQYSRVTTEIKPFESVDLNQIVKEVIGDLEIRIYETGAKINIEHLPCVCADPFQMRQLFQNIIGNAIKYHRENVPPVINVTAKTTTNEGNEYCEIKTSDNGIGFDNKFADQIFGLFQRLHNRHEYEGTGIGLSICKKIVEHHGGVITASSEMGVGSTFCITLPIKTGKNCV